MSLLVFTLLMLLLGFVAGVFGSILGLGGGIIITPVITTFFGVDIKYAIGGTPYPRPHEYPQDARPSLWHLQSKRRLHILPL